MNQSMLDVIKGAYAQWNGQKGASPKPFLDILHDDIVWVSLAGGTAGMEFTEKREGKAGVEQYFRGLASDWVMDHYTPEYFIAEGDWIVMLGSCGWTNRHTHRRFDTPKADFIRIRDGKIVEFHELYDTARILAAASPAAAKARPKAAKPRPRRAAAKSKAKGRRPTARKTARKSTRKKAMRRR